MGRFCIAFYSNKQKHAFVVVGLAETDKNSPDPVHYSFLSYQVKYGFVNDYYEYGIVEHNQLA